ncbi:MAG: hypothetical protein HLUCCO06_16635 [Halomonas sp. HL-93]|nr:MAG: hypothetical protein HLUCCO06_16635 [Halomonas sp. HL-93]
MDGSNFTGDDLLKAFTAAVANDAAGKPSFELDLTVYLDLMDDDESTEAEKVQLLEIMATIIMQIVDLGFGIHPVQHACGQVMEIDARTAIQGAEVLDSGEFNKED